MTTAPGVEAFLEPADVDFGVAAAEDADVAGGLADAAALAEAAVERGLAALEAGAYAGAGLLALHAAAGGLAEAGTHAAADALPFPFRPGGGAEITDVHQEPRSWSLSSSISSMETR